MKINAIKKGSVRPVWKDVHDKHFSPRIVFGSASPLPDDLDTDAGLTMPDQNADVRPSACTAYCTTDSATDDSRVTYSKAYNLMKTFEVENISPASNGADARIATKIGSSFGFLPSTLEPTDITNGDQTYAATPKNWPLELDKQATIHRVPAYSPITASLGYDMFDLVRIAMCTNGKRSAMLAIQWSPSFELVGIDGVLSESPTDLYWGHDCKAAGFTTKNSKGELIRNGEVFLRIKSWQGPNYGDKGYVYMSRVLANKLFNVWGVFLRTFALLSEETIENQKSQLNTFYEVTINLLQNLLGELRYQLHS